MQGLLQTSKMVCFAIIFNDEKPPTIVAKRSVLDACNIPRYASVFPTELGMPCVGKGKFFFINDHPFGGALSTFRRCAIFFTAVSNFLIRIFANSCFSK